jgi:hypothetical protein
MSVTGDRVAGARRLLLLLMGWIAALIPIHVASAGENLLLGAIRWDAWFDGSPWAKELSRKEWNYRLPFFASVDQHGKAAIVSFRNSVEPW